MLLRNVDIDGRRVDLRFDRSIEELGENLVPRDEDVIDGGGAAVIPGLHDHHVHLLALAATANSVSAVDLGALHDVCAASEDRGWLRIVGFSDEVDRAALDRVSSTRPIRVQHRSGALWTLNSRALTEVGLEHSVDGKFWRDDQDLGERLRRIDATTPPDLAWVGRELARFGITGVTDATPALDATARHMIAVAQETGALPQSVHLLSPGKLVLSDHSLPDYDSLRETIRALHEQGQSVALHCVTREAIAIAIATLSEVGVLSGDRIEHGALMDTVTTRTLAAMNVAVVTQPGFLCDRGDSYLRDVPANEHADLYRYGSLCKAGAVVVPSSDAPFGPLDPWRVIASARDRTTETGATIGTAESVPARTALDGYLRQLSDLAAPARQLMVGARADLVLLAVPLDIALDSPSAENVVRTWCAGVPV